MKKTILLSILLCFTLTFAAFSQTDEDAVQAVIQSLFDGMRAKNAEQVAAAFSQDAIMQTILATPEGNTVGTNSVGDFVKRIGASPADTQLDEQVSEYQIKVDGGLATAWTPYKFYLNGNFSHCGVNSFQLVKLSEGWKIIYIIDTRRKEPCEE
jgi:ketosteroid isomerase-like protein